MSRAARSGRAIGRGTRLALGLQVGVAGLLAVGAAALAIDVADWWYVRYDLSTSRRNTLDDEVVEVIERLPETVTIDVFFRPFAAPYGQVTAQVQGRLLDFLSVAATAHRDKLEVNTFGPDDIEAAQLRQGELLVEGDNIAVFSCGDRSTTLTLLEDVAAIDWGNPSPRGLEYLTRQGIRGVIDPQTWNPDDRAFRPARVADYRVEEAFAQALLRVASGEAPRIYFTTGHGEPDLEGTTTEDLSRLRAVLARDGFEVDTWDPDETGGQVPEDAEVVVVAGPRQPLGEATVDALRAWIEGGGRVLAAPHPEEVFERFEHGAADLLTAYGMLPQAGFVCQAVIGFAGQKVDGVPQCADFKVGENRMDHGHELAELERRHNRKLSFALTPAIEARVVPGGRFPTRLVLVPADSWLDLPDERGHANFAFEPRREEKNGNLALVCVLELGARLANEDTGVRRGRLIGAATVGLLTNGYLDANRHFVRNLFNWLAEREHRLRVTPRDPARSFLDLQRSSALPILTYGLWIGLPGLCIAIGGVLAWRRRRG